MTATSIEPPDRHLVGHTKAVFSGQKYRARLPFLLAAVWPFLFAGCGAEPVADDGAGTDSDTKTLTVFAASSLSDAFLDLEVAFEASHPGSDVRLNLAGSSALREQILAGAPADVFASANESTMAVVVANEPTVGEPTIFAQNSLAIAVPSSNPAGITGLESLADEELLIGLCSTGVPCGDAARSSLQAAGIDAAIDTNEPDVRALLTKIEAGELDAGIVYETDVLAAGDRVDSLAIAPEVNQRVVYPVIQLLAGDNQVDGEAFVAFLLSDEGQTILADHGFGPVP